MVTQPLRWKSFILNVKLAAAAKSELLFKNAFKDNSLGQGVLVKILYGYGFHIPQP